jgi:NAD(P)-dependent dehydrogenase (short-subunit alcohol dehydrogenase family)
MAETNGHLDGKRAMVTGAGTGIGRATAILYAREGARVGLIGRRAEMLRETEEAIQSFGGECLVLPCDVSDEAEVRSAYDQLVDLWGGLDILCAVAGVEPFGQPPGEGDDRVDRLELRVWQQVIDINLTGMFLSCKYAVRAMLASGGGSIIVTGSPTGMYGFALGEDAYSASKSGCHGLARVMANEYARDNIRVNISVPGFIDTPINALLFADPKLVEEFSQGIPMRRPGRPEEVAALNLWLASDESSYATGAYFIADGGQTAV